jgi:hypothetical protein
MLTPDDLETVGLLPNTRFARKPSAVSQALRAISDDLGNGRAICPVKDFHLERLHDPTRFQVLVASDRTTRERAYALAHRVYRRAGYVTASGPELCVSVHDASEQTLTLLAQDSNGNDCATISLVFDSCANGLPCDEIYRGEADALRAAGCRLAEVTRLAIDESGGAKKLLLHLFNQCYIFARIVHGHTDLLVEVNPRHVGYYQKLLRFRLAGPERPCSRVQGAPALLLRLNFAEIEAAVKVTGYTGGRDEDGRRLHAYPYSKSEEDAVARVLAQQHRPMSAEEACYFQLGVAKQKIERTVVKAK